jgi:hypothetical protein
MRFADLWRWDGKVGRGKYAAVGLIGVVIKHNLDRLIAGWFLGYEKSFFNYWAPLGPLPVPASVIDVTMRAVAIRPRYTAQMPGFDLNVVTQTMDVPDGQGFDLVVATNVLVYYDLFQQALAMGSIAHMMNHGGIFLANHALPAQHAQALEYLGRRTVAYTPSGAYGDDVVVYRRR